MIVSRHIYNIFYCFHCWHYAKTILEENSWSSHIKQSINKSVNIYGTFMKYKIYIIYPPCKQNMHNSYLGRFYMSM